MKLPRKDPAERKVVRFLFATEVASTDTIVSSTVTSTTLNGTDASPAAVLDGLPYVDVPSFEVRQRVTGGLNNCDYLLRAEVIDSVGLRHVIVGTLPVRTET